MAAYIAMKPCRFGRNAYRPGERIPADAILPKRVAALIRYGQIKVSEDEPAEGKTPKAAASASDTANGVETGRKRSTKTGR